jgi:Kyakuja-Dileera-Zisupton transposase
MLITMDGNNSLKRVLRQKPAPLDPGEGDASVVGEPNEHNDERTVGAGYYLTREQVDCWSRDIVLE